MSWDPLSSKNVATVTPKLSKRLKSDIESLFSDPIENAVIEPDETDFSKIHVLLVGVTGTPYEKGFFYFILKCPPEYPFKPPLVRLMTTGAGKVRFNPNLYADGKVCLSILGTYSGPSWTALQSIRSVLLCIQSIMNEKPYCNEPGYEREHKRKAALKYNMMILHDTIRVAVCGMVENDTSLAMPSKFVTFMKKEFLSNYKFYEKVVQENMCFSGQLIQDPLYRENKGVFTYESLLKRISSLYKDLKSSSEKNS